MGKKLKLYILIDVIITMAIFEGTNLIPNLFASVINASFIITVYLYLAYIEEIKILKVDVMFFVVNLFIISVTLRANLIFPSMLLCLYRIIGSITDKKNILSHYYIFSSLAFWLVFFLNKYLHFNSTYVMLMWRNEEWIIRESLGFVQPNAAMIFFLGIYISGVAVFFLKMKMRLGLIINTFLLYLVYFYTSSRTAFYSCLAFCVFFFIFNKYAYSISLTVKKIAIFSPIIFMTLSVFLIVLPINENLNEIMSGRITLYQKFYNSGGFSLLGNKLLEREMFDNSFLHLLLTKGIIYTSLLFSLIIRIVKNANNKTVFLYGLFILIMLCGLTETIFSKLELWIPFLLLLQEKKIVETHNYYNEIKR